MFIDSYRKVLEEAKLSFIATHICDYLTCPIHWDTKKQMAPIIPILLEKWFYTVGDLLPPGEVHPEYLKEGDEYLSAPSAVNYEWSQLADPENKNNEDLLYESRRLAENLFIVKNDIREKYTSSCIHLFNTSALTVNQYAKHYAIGAKNCEQVREFSLLPGNRDIGLLLPPLTCEIQEYALWLGLSLLFEIERNSALDDDPSRSHREAFDIAWNNTVGNLKSNGFVLDCLTRVGAYNGEFAEKLVFDLSMQTNEFHCYPALATNTSLPIVMADDLQGLDSYFDAGRKFDLWEHHGDFQGA